MDALLERLETKIAYLERANSELSDELYRQRQELDELRARLASLASRVESAGGGAGTGSAEDERPPHY